MRSRSRKRCLARAVQQRRHLGRVLCAPMCRCVAAPSESVPETDILFLAPAATSTSPTNSDFLSNKLRFLALDTVSLMS